MKGATAQHIYMLVGDDEFGIAEFVASLIAELVNPSLASMNLIRLDGKTQGPDVFFTAAEAMPLFGECRIVIVDNPTAPFESSSGKEAQKKLDQARARYLERLGKVPPTTVVVLVEVIIKDNRKAHNYKWLESWAAEAAKAGDGVALRTFRLPKGNDMVRWIQERVRGYGGQIATPAAKEMAGLIDDETRLADQEIQKLLTYVNFQRAIERDDVHLLTADMAQGDIFALADALGNRDKQKAMEMLQRQMERKEPLEIFFMIVRQFRLLIQARELMDQGKRQDEINKILQGPPNKVSPYIVGKLTAQAKRFSLLALESIYRRLLALDEAMKTSKVPGDLGLEILVAELTTGAK